MLLFLKICIFLQKFWNFSMGWVLCHCGWLKRFLTSWGLFVLLEWAREKEKPEKGNFPLEFESFLPWAKLSVGAISWEKKQGYICWFCLEICESLCICFQFVSRAFMCWFCFCRVWVQRLKLCAFWLWASSSTIFKEYQRTERSILRAKNKLRYSSLLFPFCELVFKIVATLEKYTGISHSWVIPILRHQASNLRFILNQENFYLFIFFWGNLMYNHFFFLLLLFQLPNWVYGN